MASDFDSEVSSKKVLIIIAGFGRFLGAARRLQMQCSQMDPAKYECLLIDRHLLYKISLQHGVDPTIFSSKERGYGYWQWKPLIMHHYAKSDYEAIVYLDAGCEIDPESFSVFVDWFRQQTEYDLLLSRSGKSIASYTKQQVIDELVESHALKLQLNEIEMVQCGILFLKRYGAVGKVFERATNLIQQKKYILFNDEISSQFVASESFIQHRHDQSVLSLLILQSEDVARVGVLHTSLTPPDHLNGWPDTPPIIAARNGGGVQMFSLYLRYRAYREIPVYMRFIIFFVNRLIRLAGSNKLAIGLANSILELLFQMNTLEKKPVSDTVRYKLAKALPQALKMNVR